jgi:hypothetical protein
MAGDGDEVADGVAVRLGRGVSEALAVGEGVSVPAATWLAANVASTAA